MMRGRRSLRVAAAMWFAAGVAPMLACVPALPGGMLDEGAAGTDGRALDAGAGTSGAGGSGGLGGPGGRTTGSAGRASGPGAGGGGGAPGPPGTPPFVADGGRLRNVAVDSESAYWATSPTNALKKARLTDGTSSVLSTSCSGGSFVAVGSGSVYCTVAAGPTDGGILKIPIDGSPPTIIVPSIPNQMVVGADGVYWTTFAEVMKVGLDGGSPVTLAAGQQGATALALDDTYAYWVTSMEGAVKRIGLSGGADPVTLAVVESGVGPGANLAVDATGLCWNDARGTIMKLRFVDGVVAPLLSIVVTASSLAADASGTYWTDGSGGVWTAVPPAGMRLIGRAAAAPSYGIALDATHVYWIGGGNIFRAPK